MRIKLINNDQIYLLAFNDALELIHSDENFKRNLFLTLQTEWFSIFDNGIKDILKWAKNKIKQNQKFDRTEIDRRLFDLFHDMYLEPKIAASSEFWGSLTIQHEEAKQLVKARWKHTKNWFKSKTAPFKNAENYYRRYAGSDIDRQTFARIWWISKLIPEEKKDIVFKQQDFLDKAIQNRYIFWNEKEGKNVNSRTMRFLLECLEQFDRNKLEESEYIAAERQEITRNVFNWLKLLNDTTVIELMSDSDLRAIIEDFFNKAVSGAIDEHYFKA